ncbi:MAG: thioredoxin domain-containing protein [Trueperaceae bacterium]|nr:MAG: thioredoxin domain-containing protein [Trueperaceae bacterium]
MTQHSNRLADTASPYLRQHAHQLVDWYPWGEEAFAVARERDVPVLVSIGYAACHWCHVMSHESFDDPAIAALLNDHFVSVKVDREERPDVDAVYMGAVQALSGSGGWPMTVVTTPDGKPWFAGTYFPPDDRFGRPGFARLLGALHAAWSERRDEVVDSATQITERLGHLSTRLPADDGEPERSALAALRAGFDHEHGGFGGAPKFPPHTALRWLLERPPEDGDGEPTAAGMLHLTLRRMVDGGLFDQLLGGVARYSVDERWIVPHFEKMLYDNALLLGVLARAGARFEDARLVGAGIGIARWALDVMRPDGVAFAASQDADSEGEEGRFATFTPSDLVPALPDPDDRALARALYGIDEVGVLEGRSVPVWRGLDHPAVVAALGSDAFEPERVAERVARVRDALIEIRRGRVPPAMDDKVVTSWNALMIRGLVEAAPWLPEALATELRSAAVQCADAVWERAWDGTSLRHLAPPPPPGGRGVSAPQAVALLEDAASYGLAALALHRATGDVRFLARAFALADAVERDFADGEGGFYTTPAFGEALVVRPRSTFDGPTPSEHGLAAELLAWVAAWSADAERAERAAAATRGAARLAARAPTAVASLLGVRDRLVAPPVEVIVAGAPDDERTRALLECADREAPDHALVGLVPATLPASSAADGLPAPSVPWFEGRAVERPTAFVCSAGACRAPVHDVAGLRDALAAAVGSAFAPRP